jgi:hypothetical protein
MVKNGHRNGWQRYRCPACGIQTQSTSRPNRFRKKLWHDYTEGKQTIAQLSRTYAKSRQWIIDALDAHTLPPRHHEPRTLVLAIDATFWGRKRGVLVARDPVRKENILWHDISNETPHAYRLLKRDIELSGYAIAGVVIDGKRGVAKVFESCSIAVQHCHFHQIQTITQYLTKKPKTDAGRELRVLALSLPRTDEQTFREALATWYARHADFLSERTDAPYTKRGWVYTHQRVKSAYRSLVTNLPHLFTYRKYPDLHLPNTTNTLDGSFSHLKSSVRLHRGKTPERRYKLISELLRKKESER